MAAALNRAVNEARHLYVEQRSVAHHLERSLIPERLPELEGLETACRYEPGATGVEIGGDWYDLVPLGDDRAFFVVGDVSGRGIAAAAVMARLRFAVLAYVQVGFSPDGVLDELANLISMEEVGHFATMVCGILDLGSHELVMANAGHLPPLLLVGHETTFLSEGVGVPIGVSDETKYETVTVKVPPSATLLVYTDGLVERRTERIEAGMNRLAGTALQYRTLRLETQVNKIVEEMTRPGSEDDAALLGIRWQS
jgi:serine phosphatase RsbU (regulator of sigma subunit)